MQMLPRPKLVRGPNLAEVPKKFVKKVPKKGVHNSQIEYSLLFTIV